jgi:hypothetical protein
MLNNETRTWTAPLIAEAARKARQEGRQEGMQVGEHRGVILTLLPIRFPREAAELLPQAALVRDLESASALRTALVNGASVDEVRALLQRSAVADSH